MNADLSRTKASGGALEVATGKTSEIRSAEFSEAKRVAAIAWTLVREIFPSQVQESDAALALRLEMLAQVAVEVGPDHFNLAVKRAIAASSSRHQVTIARIREFAGVPVLPPKSEAAKEWDTVMQILVNHVQTDPEGNYRLEQAVRMVRGTPVVTPVPTLSAAAVRAVRSLGGWGALRTSYPEYISQKWRDFREFYEPDEKKQPMHLP